MERLIRVRRWMLGGVVFTKVTIVLWLSAGRLSALEFIALFPGFDVAYAMTHTGGPDSLLTGNALGATVLAADLVFAYSLPRFLIKPFPLGTLRWQWQDQSRTEGAMRCCPLTRRVSR